MKKVFILLLFSSLYLTSCTTFPTKRVWQPWTRTFLDNQNELLPGTTLKVNVAGSTESLLGNENLFQNDIKKRLVNLLERKGYKSTESNSDYNLILNYKTFRHDKIETNSIAASSSSNLYYVNSDTDALGVAIAGLIMGLSHTSNKSRAQTTSESIESYNHIISIEVFKNNDVLFKGESAWDSYSPDLRRHLTTALQIILSNLEADNNVIPSVSEVNYNKRKNYYNLKVRDVEFSSPALPYEISFNTYSEISDPVAFEAFVDLLQTAEYALPLGDDEYSNPIDPYLWNEVMLGGKYYIGKNSKPSKILIKLTTSVDGGYLVKRCWLASDEEYKEYENQLSKWKTALKDYYDVYSE